jgi:lysozyme family protein
MVVRAMTTEQAIDAVLRREGGYVNHPDDRGGCTNYGITRATLEAWRGRRVTCEDVRALSVGEARSIYVTLYVTGPRFDEIADDRIRALCIDWAVQSGPVVAAKALQRAAGVEADGMIGPDTLAAVAGGDPARLYRAVLAARCDHIARILEVRADQRVFAAGWLRRLAEFV